jgi:hypothetical protein
MIKKMVASDWLSMKEYHQFLLFIIIYMIGGCFIVPFAVLPANAMMLSTFSVNPFAIEEKSDLNHLYLTLPIKRRDIVFGRYAFSFVMFICGMLISSVAMLITQPISLTVIIMPNLMIGFSQYFTLLSATCLLYAVFNLTSFPFLFKLGYAKGKIWGFYLPVLFIMILVIAIMLTIIAAGVGNELFVNIAAFVSENTLLISMGMIVVAAGILAVSYLLSVKFYTKRDF